MWNFRKNPNNTKWDREVSWSKEGIDLEKSVNFGTPY